MSAIKVFGTSYDFPAIKDERFEGLQEEIRKTRERIERSEKPASFLRRREELSPDERLALMEGLVGNYDELIRVLRSKIDGCHDVFMRMGRGVQAEFSKRLADLEKAEGRRAEMASRMSAMGKAEAAGAMGENQERIRTLAKQLTRASILIVRKLKHALDALETLANDDESQKLVYEQLKSDVAVYREVYEFNKDLAKLEREIAEMTKLALSFDGILRNNLGPLSILIDEIGKVDARLGESLLEIERLSIELEEGKSGALGHDMLSDELMSNLISTRIKGDSIEEIITALADPREDHLVTDFEVEVSASVTDAVDFAALAANMADLMRRGLDALHSLSGPEPMIQLPQPLPAPVPATPAPTPPAPAVPALTPGLAPAPVAPTPATPAWTPPPPRAEAVSSPWSSKDPYTAAISRASPTLVLFLLDRSGSMEAPYSGGRSRAEYLARVVDSAIAELSVRCNKADGIRDYFHIAALGYGNGSVASAFGGTLGSADWHAISRIASSPIAVDREPGAAPRPRWVEPRAEGDTPMKAAMEKACALVASWCDAHPSSYPPTILNITDGESTDGSPEDAAAILRRLHTDDGEALLFNLHVAGSGTREIIFPDDELGIDDNGKLLFRMSSGFPPHLLDRARSSGFNPGQKARFFVYGAGAELATRFLDLGTRPAKLV